MGGVIRSADMAASFVKGDLVNRRYRVLKQLGAGGMGAVVLVERVRGRGQFALKYCTEADDEGVRRFAREVRAMKRVDHPNVIKILEDDVDHDPPYFVMPVAKGSLSDELEALSADQDAALVAFLQVCDGVEAIHTAVGPHRDLKPSNALRLSDDTVVVSDFGLIKIDPRDTTSLTRTSVLMGTEGYMAPEQRRRGGTKNADGRVDVYALGAFLSELLTGEPPPPVDMSEMSPALAHIIRKAMSQLLTERYPSVADLAAAVRNLQRLKQVGKDPRRVVIDARVAAAKAFVSADEWDADAAQLMCQALRGLRDEPRALTDEFELIPPDLLAAVATQLPSAMTDSLDAYGDALNEIASSMAWSYAETVADRMFGLMKVTKDPDVRARAVRATLIAASDLGRFAALDTFEKMLRYIKKDATARAVAAVLRDEAKRFARHTDRFRDGDLHTLIRDVVDELRAQKDDSSK